MNKCIRCSQETVNSKFCSRSCANSVNNRSRIKPAPQNECKFCKKVTTNKVFCSSSCCTIWNNANSMTPESQKKRGQKNIAGTKTPKSIFDLSSRTMAKILVRMEVGCSVCGWKEAACDVHHIVPRGKGGSNDHTNLTLLCPNHHRLAHAGKISKLVTLTEQIGEKWREHYYAHA